MNDGTWSALGMAIGTAIEVSLDRTAMGVALCAAFGVAVGSIQEATRKRWAWQARVLLWRERITDAQVN